jgi:signal transduction histidine kinase/ligand-binding sensor domain-containing protein
MRQALLHIFMFCAASWSAAFASDLRFRQFSTRQGFPSKDVNVTIQDSDGYMWFGTYNGLYRYDGTDFFLYVHSAADAASLPSNNISSLYVCASGQLYVGGAGFFCMYNKKADNFTRFDNTFLKGAYTNSIAQSGAGDIFLGTYKGLYKADTVSFKLLPTTIQAHVWDIHIKDSLIYLATQNNGIIAICQYSNKIISHISSETYTAFLPSSSSVYSFAEDEDGLLWFSCSSGGLYSYCSDSDSLQRQVVLHNGQESVHNIHAVYAGHGGKIFAASINNGLSVYCRITGLWQHYTAEFPEKLSITSNSIREIYCDNSGTLWFSTHFGGVCFLRIQDSGIDYFYRSAVNEGSLGHNIVSSFAESPDGVLWVGTDGGGLYKHAPCGGFSKIGKKQGLRSEAVTSLSADNEGHLWVSQWLGGVQRFSFATESFSQQLLFGAERQKTRESEIKGILADSKGRVWMFPHFLQPHIYDTETAIMFSAANKGKFPPEIFTIDYGVMAAEEQGGNIWIAAAHGLFKYSGQFKLAGFYNSQADTASIPMAAITNVFIDPENRVWIATSEGLELYDRETGGFKHISRLPGFPKIFYGLQQDTLGRIWFTSQQGLGMFDPGTWDIWFFDRNIGLAGDDFISRSQFRRRDGTLLFGSTDGFIAIRPWQINPDTAKFNVAITELQLFNEPVCHITKPDILSMPISSTDTIILPHRYSVFSIRFSALQYAAYGNMSYSYMLEGFDQSWNHIRREQKATYTNLPPGTYTFTAKASTPEGAVGQSRKIAIIILPPWWDTWWFRTVYISLLVCAAAALFIRKIQQEKMLNKELSALVDERTSELTAANADLQSKNEELRTQNDIITVQREELGRLNKTKDKFFSIIAHDLKNPMHTLLGFSDILLKRFDTLSEDKKLQFVDAISRSSQSLFALMVNLLDWARSQSKSMDVNPERILLASAADEAIKLLSHNAASKNIIVNASLHEQTAVYADRNMFATILRNLLSNAIKFTAEGGRIDIEAETANSSVILMIRDSGNGIPAERLSKLFVLGESRSTEGTANETGTGLGLILCKEFATHNGGDIWANSEIGKGSVFFVRMPAPL